MPAKVGAASRDVALGRVFEIGVSSERTATFTVTVQLGDAGEHVRPGMTGDVEFSFKKLQDEPQYRVPSVAVGEDRDGRFLYVLKSSGQGLGTVTRRPVRLGQLTADGLEVLEGIEHGDLVVTAGVNHIRDGQSVRIPPQSEP